MSCWKSITGTMAHSRLVIARPVSEILCRLTFASLSVLLSLPTLLGLTTAPLCAAGFLTAPTYHAGIAPVAVAVGDFNGDGIPDLAVANSTLLPNGEPANALVGLRVSGLTRRAGHPRL
jgi:hypothetical protein